MDRAHSPRWIPCRAGDPCEPGHFVLGNWAAVLSQVKVDGASDPWCSRRARLAFSKDPEIWTPQCQLGPDRRHLRNSRPCHRGGQYVKGRSDVVDELDVAAHGGWHLGICFCSGTDRGTCSDSGHGNGLHRFGIGGAHIQGGTCSDGHREHRKLSGVLSCWSYSHPCSSSHGVRGRFVQASRGGTQRGTRCRKGTERCSSDDS